MTQRKQNRSTIQQLMNVIANSTEQNIRSNSVFVKHFGITTAIVNNDQTNIFRMDQCIFNLINNILKVFTSQCSVHVCNPKFKGFFYWQLTFVCFCILKETCVFVFVLVCICLACQCFYFLPSAI